jgi:ATP-dependent 26S proteasome regulatory subunit
MPSRTLQGVLMYGPPGTGKTLLARAVANRTDACFIRVIGSELVQKYVGEGARMVRELFQMARSKKVRRAAETLRGHVQLCCAAAL